MSNTNNAERRGFQILKPGEDALPNWIGLACLTAAATLSWVLPNPDDYRTVEATRRVSIGRPIEGVPRRVPIGLPVEDRIVEQAVQKDAGVSIDETVIEWIAVVVVLGILAVMLFAVLATLRAIFKYVMSLRSPKEKEAPAKSDEAEATTTTETKRSEEPVLTSSAGSWAAMRAKARAQSPVEAAKGKIRSILNKLTEERFDILYDQLIAIKVLESDELLECLVEEVCEKAIQQHTHKDDHFVSLYTSLCMRLQEQLLKEEDELEDGAGSAARLSAFKRILTARCETTYEKYRTPPAYPEDLEEEELLEEELKYKTRWLGTMKLAGHLFGHEMLTTDVLLRWAGELLGDTSSPEDMEAMCALLTVAGPFLDGTGRPGSTEFEASMTKLSGVTFSAETKGIPRRTLCLIKDLLDARCRAWGANKKIEKTESNKSESRQPKESHAARYSPAGGKNTKVSPTASAKHSPKELAAMWFGPQKGRTSSGTWSA